MVQDRLEQMSALCVDPLLQLPLVLALAPTSSVTSMVERALGADSLAVVCVSLLAVTTTMQVCSMRTFLRRS